MVIKHLRILLILALFFPTLSIAQSRYRGVNVSHGLTADDYGVLGSWKANTVRYLLHWPVEANTATEAEYFVWLTSKLDEFDALLPVFQAQNIKVVLDLHTPPGGFSVTGSPSTHRIFTDAWAQAAFVTAWQQMATRYLGNTTIWAFELCNEPATKALAAGMKDWRTLALVASQAIRAIDPTRTIIVEAPYGDQARLNKIPPLPLSNIVYSVHMYYPLSFQHQGLYGRPYGVVYPKKKFNKAALLRNLQKIIKYQKKNKVQVFIGEFSAVRWAPKDSAYKYLRDVISIFEKYKWHWAYHAFREANVWSVEHTTDRYSDAVSPVQTNREALLRKHFAKN